MQRHPYFSRHQLRQQRVAQGGEGAGFVDVRDDMFQNRMRYILEGSRDRSGRQAHSIVAHDLPACPRHFCTC